MEILLWIGLFVVSTAVFIYFMFFVRLQENTDWYRDHREIPNLWGHPVLFPVSWLLPY
ncbi:hypothetical protein [Auritidibacter ignavus]|uniref:hypothetical protein n=1 Tax=Auritidibacter ignavus TaxID=678932 RepID=UPI0024BA2F24|nr:hypothetical protein [Auritidibacter ignavus]WHS34306.1 hypothetical protein QM403_08120 [Auritidibacter ignavus]